jgi:hypothetical protein
MISPDDETPLEHAMFTNNTDAENTATQHSNVVVADILRESLSTQATVTDTVVEKTLVQDPDKIPHESMSPEVTPTERFTEALGATPHKEASNQRENVSSEISPEKASGQESKDRDAISEDSREFGGVEGQDLLETKRTRTELEESRKRQRRQSKNRCRYKKRRISLLRGIYPRVMRCFDPEGKEFFVTYGHRRTDVFLLEYRYRAPGLVVKALVPSTPTYNFHRPNQMLTTFLRELEIGNV